MHWYDIVARFGDNLMIVIGISCWIALNTLVTFQWRCGLCGKFNQTGLIKFLLMMCDHQGIQ